MIPLDRWPGIRLFFAHERRALQCADRGRVFRDRAARAARAPRARRAAPARSRGGRARRRRLSPAPLIPGGAPPPCGRDAANGLPLPPRTAPPRLRTRRLLPP